MTARRPAIARDHIVAELQRTARANGGKPVGRQRFAALTGIREADWAGRYWARWSDALTDAGLPANVLQGRYDDAAVIGRLVPVIRRLGRMPTIAEIRLERRGDPSFPSAGVLAKFGDKLALVRQVAELCRARDDCGDVFSLLAPMLDQRDGADADRAAPTVELGYVYLLRAGKHYKLGRTNAFGRRERELAIQLPVPATTVHVIKTDDPVGIEDYWHRRFADRRGNGEWFALTPADVGAFWRRSFM